MTDTSTRARTWVASGSGIPARTVWAHMMGLSDFHVAAPQDVRDIESIIELLDCVPEWRPRMAELSFLSPDWEKIAPIWAEIERHPRSVSSVLGISSRKDRGIKMGSLMGSMLAQKPDWEAVLKSYEGHSLERRADKWVVGADTGMSSRAIWAAMLGLGGRADNPSDPADLGRCLRLLAIIPEWKSRIGEMAGKSPEWDALLDHWDEVAESMEDEVGVAWQKATAAPRTYALMRGILHEARKTA